MRAINYLLDSLGLSGADFREEDNKIIFYGDEFQDIFKKITEIKHLHESIVAIDTFKLSLGLEVFDEGWNKYLIEIETDTKITTIKEIKLGQISIDSVGNINLK